MTNQQQTNDNTLEPTVRAFDQLSPQSQEMAMSLVRQLAEREGINVSLVKQVLSGSVRWRDFRGLVEECPQEFGALEAVEVFGFCEQFWWHANPLE